MSDSLATQGEETSAKVKDAGQADLARDSAKLYYCWPVTENHLAELADSLPNMTWQQLAKDYLFLSTAEVEKAKAIYRDTGSEDAKLAMLHAWQSNEPHPSIGNLLEHLCDAADGGLLDMKSFRFLLHPSHTNIIDEFADEESENAMSQKGIFAERMMYAIFLSVFPSGVRDLVHQWRTLSAAGRIMTAAPPVGILLYTLFFSSSSRLRLPLLTPSHKEEISRMVRPSHYTGMKHFAADEKV